MEGKDDRVTCFQRNQSFENSSRCWISCWSYPTDNTYRLSDRDQTLLFIFSNNTDRLVIFDAFPNVFRSIHIFYSFVFINTTTCFVNSQFCKIHVFIKRCDCCMVNNVIHLLLCKVSHFIEGFNPLYCQFINYCLNIFSLFNFFSHIKLLLSTC